MPCLSVIIPAYNEQYTIESLLNKIDAVKIDKEIIVINNGSTDRTQEILDGLKIPCLKVVSLQKNIGKGGAFRTGLKNAVGDIVIIQDADLEYDPRDYSKLIQPILDNQCDFVLGVRFSKGYKGLFFHQQGNRFLTWFMNLLYASRLNDVLTCYKASKREIFNSLDLKSSDFAIEPEIVSKILKKDLRILEVPVSYHPRSYSEGKKIRIKDAFTIIVKMIILRLFWR